MCGEKSLLLTFFPRCFAGQFAPLQREKPNFERLGIEVWAISTDKIEGWGGLKMFAKPLKLSFPLLSDTSRQVYALYGAAQSRDDLARRQSVFIEVGSVVRLIDREVRVQSHGRGVAVFWRGCRR